VGDRKERSEAKWDGDGKGHLDDEGCWEMLPRGDTGRIKKGRGSGSKEEKERSQWIERVHQKGNETGCPSCLDGPQGL